MSWLEKRKILVGVDFMLIYNKEDFHTGILTDHELLLTTLFALIMILGIYETFDGFSPAILVRRTMRRRRG